MTASELQIADTLDESNGFHMIQLVDHKSSSLLNTMPYKFYNYK